MHARKREYPVKMNAEEIAAMNELKNDTGFIASMARKGAKKPFKMVKHKGQMVPSMAPFENATTNKRAAEVEQKRRSDQAYRDAVAAQQAGGGDGGSGGGGSNAPMMNKEQAMKQFGLMENVDLKAMKKTAAEDALKTERESARQGFVDKFGGYEGDLRNMRGRADFSDFRNTMSGYGTEADKLRTDAKTQFGNYRSQIDQMADDGANVRGLAGQAGTARQGYGGLGTELQGLRGQVGSQVAGTQGQMDAYRGDVGSARGDVKAIQDQMGQLASQAQDPNQLMRNRGLFEGQLETQRKGAEEGNLANIRRSMAASGASPQEIARAVSEAQKGSAQAGREDALKASQMALQSGQGMLAQAGGFMGNQANLASQRAALTGQQAGMAMQGGQMGLQGIGQQAGMAGQQAGLIGANIGAMGQQAGMYGQAQGLGLQQIGAGANMYNQGLGAQQNLMNFGAGMAGQGQASLGNEIGIQSGLTGQMGDMTGVQLQDTVAKLTAAQQKELAEKSVAANASAASASSSGGGGGGLLGMLGL